MPSNPGSLWEVRAAMAASSVDDEPDIRKVVRMTLQKAGYDVLEAENGEKAIETINYGENRLLLDVIICDIRMPKVNGIEAIAYFRQNYTRVPLIVLTGFPTPIWPRPYCDKAWWIIS